MRVCISGAHGVGKSTLAAKLSRQLWIHQITEVARDVAKLWELDNIDDIQRLSHPNKAKFQENIFNVQLHRESWRYNCSKDYISDRSVWDCLAYTSYYGLPISTKQIEEAMQHMENIDLIIYCPIPDGFMVAENDGFRQIWGSREIDEILRHMLQNQGPKVKYLSTDRDTWFKEAMQLIKEVADGPAV